MLPLQKKFHIKLCPSTPKSFISSTPKNAIVPRLQINNNRNNNEQLINKSIKNLREILSNNKPQLPKSKLLSISRIDFPATSSDNKLNSSTIQERSCFTIMKNIKLTCKSRAGVNQSVCNTEEFMIPNEDSYKEIKLFVQGVKEFVSEINGVKKSLVKVRLKTADTEASDSPKYNMETPQTTKIEEILAKNKDQIEFPQDTEGKNVELLLASLVTRTDILKLRMAVHDIMFPLFKHNSPALYL